MIIDAHTHIYPDHVAKKALRTIFDNTKGRVDTHTNGTYDNLLSSMETAGIDLSIVLTIATSPGQGCGRSWKTSPDRARSPATAAGSE